jgi:two-component system LytT family sensor kinase
MSASKFKRIGIHILFWVLYILYDTINANWGDHLSFEQTHKLWANIPLIIAIVYFNLYILMPRYFYQKKYGAYVICLIAVIIGYGLLAKFISYGFWLQWDKKNDYSRYLSEPKKFFVPIRIARNMFRLYPVLALSMLVKILRNSYSKEKQLRITETEQHKAELNYLQAQMHPHFFFNTLSSLYALTLKKADEAPVVVMRLSGLMRYMLYETNAGMVFLDNEITHLKNYIAIEELRFADRLEYSFQSSGDIAGKRISPLLLLPFVENAFKHSLSNEVNKAWVTIDIKVTGYQLFFNIENSISALNTQGTHQGIGLANVKKRLGLVYPYSHQLIIKQEGNIFGVNLKLQLNEKD